ncbi:restriction endonuclease subunit S [Mycoplasmopsis fermentans]|uniref:restriction endonuclease subunit S n=1 Tax=Mycoplasmopsis fermentans TaxID=2115 RepID=UPI000F02C998|nr:restriction endonuclease subunit S [Mycoplasmopsis fermentans]RMX35415.1 type I restriction modification DNA specificity domain protein [Mycoplasmopsis fermentans MF-I1]
MTCIDFKLKEYLPLKSKFELVPLLSTIKLIPSSNKLSKKHYLENGKYPIVDQGNSLISGYTNENNPISIKECIVFGDHTRIIKYIDFPFYPGADGIKIFNSKNENIFLTKFIFYYINSLEITNLGYSRHWKLFEDFKIPLIPLKIQEKIVEILERFRILEAELKAELEARGKQFDFISNCLLIPKIKNIKWINLSEKFEFVRGLNYKFDAEKFVNDIKPINVLRANNIQLEMNNLNLNDIKKVFLKNVDEKYILSKNDILISIASGSKKHLGKLFFSSANTDYYFGGFLAVIRKINKDYNPKYLYYLLNSKIFKKYLEIQLNTSTINNINNQIIYNFKIPLISLEVQNKIVSILDKLSEYSQEINSGLPAEIELRSKQFKYYRDQLLNFKNNE